VSDRNSSARDASAGDSGFRDRSLADSSHRGAVDCRLVYEAEGEQRVKQADQRPIVIGRAPDCDLVLRDESVSRNHARITFTDGAWWIQDLGSKNGVKINTYRAARQRLRDGDRIDLGTMRVFVEIGASSRASRANVVFENDREQGLRTEIIEMDRLDSLLVSSVEFAQGPELSAPLQPEGWTTDHTPPPESGELLRLFSEAAEALISCDSLDETLERILALVFNNLPAERGVICLYHEDEDRTEPKVMRTREGGTDEPIVISSHIANDVIKRKQSLLVQDTQQDERFGGAESVISLKIHSAMCAPLYRDGRVVGFVYVDRQSDKHPFVASHLQALSTLAILSAVAVEQAALRDEIRREQDIRARLSRYSSPGVVDRIVDATHKASHGMVAEEGDVTVLFSDLAGFTGMAERLAPGEVVQMLNMVFEKLTDTIFELDGTLDKFRGDGLMAFFGAPLPMADHAQRAVDAALRMQDQIAELNAASGLGRSIDMRIGINSGQVVVGDIGSPQRKDYTVVGDVVNTASRLESSVALSGQVVIGEATWERVKHRFRCQALDEVHLKGKRESVRPYLVLGEL